MIERPFTDIALANEILTDSSVVFKHYGSDKMLSKEDGFMTDFHFYIHRSALTCNELEIWLEQLIYGVKRIGRYTDSDCMSEGEGFIYDRENYIVRLNSIMDRIMQFLNSVMDMGINDKNVTYGSVVSNTKIRVYPEIVTVVKKVKKLLTPYADMRNILIHRHAIREKIYMDIKLMSNVVLWKQLYRENYDTASSHWVKVLQKQSSEDVIKYTELNKLLFAELEKLMNLCQHPYDKNKCRLNI